MEGSSANRKPVSDGGIMEQADVPEEGDSLVGGWGRRALSSARTSPARRLINARKLACTFHMEKLIQKTASHSKLENGTIKLVERPQQRINMAFRARCAGPHESLHHHRSRKSNELHPHRPCRTISSHHTRHTNDAQSDRHPTTTETSNAVGLLAN
mgnify:CR=1 FL=1